VNDTPRKDQEPRQMKDLATRHKAIMVDYVMAQLRATHNEPLRCICINLCIDKRL